MIIIGKDRQWDFPDKVIVQSFSAETTIIIFISEFPISKDGLAKTGPTGLTSGPILHLFQPRMTETLLFIAVIHYQILQYHCSNSKALCKFTPD